MSAPPAFTVKAPATEEEQLLQQKYARAKELRAKKALAQAGAAAAAAPQPEAQPAAPAPAAAAAEAPAPAAQLALVPIAETGAAPEAGLPARDSLGGAALQVLSRTPLPALASPAAAPDEARPARVLTSQAEVAALLAKRRGAPQARPSAAASPLPRALVEASPLATPARAAVGSPAALPFGSPLAQTPAAPPSAGGSERRPAIKRPAVRPTPAAGEAKRSRLGPSGAAEQWAKVLSGGGGAQGGAEEEAPRGGGGAPPAPHAAVHLRQVYISNLAATVDRGDLLQARSP